MTDQLAIRDQRQPGWFWIDNEILDQYSERLGAYGVAVYNVLSRNAKNGTQRVNLSARDIGAMLGISHDRVRKSLRDLADIGLIHIQIPERPAPGVISTITLLNVKKELDAIRPVQRATGRQTSSSPNELDATRPRNKEVKTKTETKTNHPHLFEKQRPNDSQFVGRSVELRQCPLNSCDGSGWWAEEKTRRVIYCRCSPLFEADAS
jgi:hypothetical protein